MITTASRIGDVREYYFATKLREIAKMREEGLPVLNLGIGSPDLPPPSEAIDILYREARLDNTHGYQSYTGIPELRRAVADWYKRFFDTTIDPEEEVLPLMGSKEGIMHISMTYLEAGDAVLVPNPGYPTYRAVAKLTGADIFEYALKPENNWLPDFDALEQMDLKRVKMMWVNYPHMPTGTPATPELFEQLVGFAKKHRLLLVNDNPYAFILNERPLSLLSIPGAKEVAIELNSLSKALNMAGWRVGAMMGKADYLKTILRFKSNMDSGMFRPVQLAAAKALASPDQWYRDLNAVYRERRAKVFELFELLECSYDPAQTGMFVWARIPEQVENAYTLSDEVLYQNHVFVTPGGIFGSEGERYLRISLCSDGVLYEEAIRRIRERLEQGEEALVAPSSKI